MAAGAPRTGPARGRIPLSRIGSPASLTAMFTTHALIDAAGMPAARGPQRSPRPWNRRPALAAQDVPASR
jgi:hypothetical protein